MREKEHKRWKREGIGDKSKLWMPKTYPGSLTSAAYRAAQMQSVAASCNGAGQSLLACTTQSVKKDDRWFQVIVKLLSNMTINIL